MDWFRMYHDARSDKKLQSLSDSEFRIWFNLLCFASEQSGKQRGSIPKDNLYLLAVEVAQGNESILVQTIDKLVALEILADKKIRYEFLHWKTRQFISDSSSERVKKHRQSLAGEKKRDSASVSRPARNVSATLQKRSSNGTVTPMKQDVTAPDTDTDPDPETDLKDLDSSSNDRLDLTPNQGENLPNDTPWSSSSLPDKNPAKTGDPTTQALAETWYATSGRMITGYQVALLREYLDTLELAVVLDAMRRIDGTDHRGQFAYLEGILRNRRDLGLVTVAAVEDYETRRQSGKSRDAPPIDSPIRASPDFLRMIGQATQHTARGEDT